MAFNLELRGAPTWEKMLLFAADGKTLKTSCFWSSDLMFAVRLSEFVE